MCIRDSLMDVYSTMAKEKLPFSVAIAKRLDWNAKRLSEEAVSYTHLRAHETVLDIVCRLLLQKKNQKK